MYFLATHALTWGPTLGHFFWNNESSSSRSMCRTPERDPTKTPRSQDGRASNKSHFFQGRVPLTVDWTSSATIVASPGPTPSGRWRETEDGINPVT